MSRSVLWPLAILAVLNSPMASAAPPFAHSTTIELDTPLSLSIGEIDTLFFFWELFEDPKSPVPISAEELRVLTIGFGRRDTGIPITVYQDFAIKDEIIQPLGGVQRLGFTLVREDMSLPALPGGSFFLDSQGAAVLTTMPPGEFALTAYTAGLAIPFNSVGPTPVDIFIDEWGGGSLIGFHTISLATITTTEVVPIPGAAWLFGTALVGLMFGHRRN
jgi:hypothetical protein